MRPLAFDAAVARVVDRWTARAVRRGISSVVTGVGLGLAAVLIARTIEGFESVSALLLGGLFPIALALLVTVGGLLLLQSDLDGQQSAHIGIWWAIGTVVAGTTGLAIIVFEASNGVSLSAPAVIISGNAATGGFGGMVVGWYDAKRLAIAAEREREREKLADEREKLALINRIVRHDIGNDLQVIGGMADVLERHVDGDGQRVLERLQRSTEEAIDLTERVRAFVSMLEDDDTLHPVSLKLVVRTQVDNTRQRHPEATVTVDGELPDVAVRADELLAAAVHNLLSNAIAHNDTPNPDVQVSVDVEPDVVRLSVADDGPGIPEERKETLFERGEFGADSDGTGIGLYIVDMLVDRYDGRVWIEDNDPTGAVFVVELPRVRTESADENETADIQPTSP